MTRQARVAALVAGGLLLALGVWAVWPRADPLRLRPPALDADRTSDLRAALAAINLAYASNPRLRMDVTYTARAVGSVEVMQSEEGEVRRDGARVWWKVGDVEVLSDPTVHITIDRGERTIAVRPPTDAPPAFTDAAAFVQAIEGVVGRCDRATSAESGAGGEIHLVCPVSSYGEVRIGYRTADHLIDRLVLTTRPSPALASGAAVELEVRYRDIATTMTAQEAPPAPEELLPLAAGGRASGLDGYEVADLRAGGVP